MPSTYISPDIDYDLYRIQGIEKEAYAIGQSHTLNALNEVENSSGKLDALRNEYFASVKNDSFQAALQDAAKHYNDPNIESTLQSVINDREIGITPDNPSESYQSISTLYDNYGIHSSVDVGNVAEFNSSPEDSQTALNNDGLPQVLVQNPDVSTQTEPSEENNTINDESTDNVSSYGFLLDATGYIDDGSSLFSNESSTLIVQTDSYDDGLSNIDIGISSGSSTSSDNDMSGDI